MSSGLEKNRVGEFFNPTLPTARLQDNWLRVEYIKIYIPIYIKYLENVVWKFDGWMNIFTGFFQRYKKWK